MYARRRRAIADGAYSILDRIDSLSMQQPTRGFQNAVIKAREYLATAMEACLVLVLERRDFLPFLERHPQTCIKLLSVLCGRLRQTNLLIEDSLFLNVESRFAKRLLGFARQYGEPKPDGILIRLKLSQQEIAALIGVTRESVNKQLSAWQERGWVKVSRGAILVTDIEALESVVDITL